MHWWLLFLIFIFSCKSSINSTFLSQASSPLQVSLETESSCEICTFQDRHKLMTTNGSYLGCAFGTDTFKPKTEVKEKDCHQSLSCENHSDDGPSAPSCRTYQTDKGTLLYFNNNFRGCYTNFEKNFLAIPNGDLAQVKGCGNHIKSVVTPISVTQEFRNYLDKGEPFKHLCFGQISVYNRFGADHVIWSKPEGGECQRQPFQAKISPIFSPVLTEDYKCGGDDLATPFPKAPTVLMNDCRKITFILLPGSKNEIVACHQSKNCCLRVNEEGNPESNHSTTGKPCWQKDGF